MSDKEEIWVLGNEVDGVDRCITWSLRNLPNFSDFDKLIVDMTTLSDSSLYFVDWENAMDIFQQIKKRFDSGGQIVCILKEKFDATNSKKTIINNYFWCPIFFNFKKVTTGIHIRPIDNFEFDDYLSKVKSWNVEIEEPKCKIYPSDSDFEGSVSADANILTQSWNSIGGVYRVNRILGGSIGKLTMLPPIESSIDGIYSILKTWGRVTSTPPPDWIESIDLPGFKKIKEDISTKKIEQNEIKTKISELFSEKQELSKWKKLIFTDGLELEKIVKESLEFIGFQNVRKGVDNNSEDLLFDFQIDEKDFSTIEVKGSKKNIEQDHLRQAVDWAMKNEKDGKNVKAVLIPNIFRLEDYSSSKSKRLDFKAFGDFCQTRDLCIFPPPCIFDLVIAKLEGKSINVKKLEEMIISTKGVITDITSTVE